MRLFEREIGNLFLNIVKGAKVAKVTKVQEKEKTKQRPQALNTVEMLQIASSGLGIGPQQTMQLAEKLYTQVGNGRDVFSEFCHCFIGQFLLGVRQVRKWWYDTQKRKGECLGRDNQYIFLHHEKKMN